MRLLKSGQAGFKEGLERLTRRKIKGNKRVEQEVRRVIRQVRMAGDWALMALTERFDGVSLTPKTLSAGKGEIEALAKKVGQEELRSLKRAAGRIRRFHEKFKGESWFYEEDGIILGQIVRPLRRVGIYVPGGKASYPSSLLMNAIPAKVAGVEEIIVCTPPRPDFAGPSGPAKYLDPLIAASAWIAGVERIFKVGGAQAIAALAYGTESVPKVDKVVGPGHIYVTTAKRMVFGDVSIDMLAGPSEILIIADDSASAPLIAVDLISQAEHDEMALCLLLTPSEPLARKVIAEVKKRLIDAGNSTAALSLKRNGAAVITSSLEEAVELANELAFEHLQIMTSKPRQVLNKIRNAGAVFLGNFSPVVVGDYLAGPNHTLPTGGTARFSSPLSVSDFVKSTSVISYDKESLAKARADLKRLALMEGLKAHALAVEERFAGG